MKELRNLEKGNMNRKYIIDFILRRFNIVKHVCGNSKIKFKDLIIKIPQFRKKETYKIINILGVPVKVYRHGGNKDYIKSKLYGKTTITLNFDIIGEIHDYLTLSMEHENQIQKPIVDLLIYYFYEIIKSEIDVELKNYKNYKNFVVCVTHDVDRTGDNLPFKIIKNIVKGLKGKNIELLKSIFSRKNEDFKIEDILKVEKKFGVEESTWFFLSSTKKFIGCTLPKYADYELNDKFFKKSIKLLVKNEIGLHIPFGKNSYRELLEEREKLKEFDIIGARAHYLVGKYPDLLVELNKAKFQYDSTFGSNEKFSFCFGTSFPFHPLINGNVLKIYEVPLNIMDSNILSYKQFREYIKNILKILRSTHGVLTINWHPNRFNTKEFGNLYKKCFKILLSESKKNNAWMTSIRNLIKEVS